MTFTELLELDLQKNPHILFAYGGIEEGKLSKALDESTFNFPKDLISFWRKYGGGDLFETETILSPLNEVNENIFTYSSSYWEKGLPANLLVFHVGLFTSVIDEKGSVKIADDKLSVGDQEYKIDEWYSILRIEYLGRYTNG